MAEWHGAKKWRGIEAATAKMQAAFRELELDDLLLTSDGRSAAQPTGRATRLDSSDARVRLVERSLLVARPVSEEQELTSLAPRPGSRLPRDAEDWPLGKATWAAGPSRTPAPIRVREPTSAPVSTCVVGSCVLATVVVGGDSAVMLYGQGREYILNRSLRSELASLSRTVKTCAQEAAVVDDGVCRRSAHELDLVLNSARNALEEASPDRRVKPENIRWSRRLVRVGITHNTATSYLKAGSVLSSYRQAAGP